MSNKFYYRGRVNGKIRDGVLYIPRSVRDFYGLDREYLARKVESGGYRYLVVHSGKELVQEFLDRSEDNEPLSEFEPLEVVVRNTKKGLKLQPDFLDYLYLEKNSKVTIIGYGRPCFEIWKRIDSKRFLELINLERVMASLARKGI